MDHFLTRKQCAKETEVEEVLQCTSQNVTTFEAKCNINPKGNNF